MKSDQRLLTSQQHSYVKLTVTLNKPYYTAGGSITGTMTINCKVRNIQIRLWQVKLVGLEEIQLGGLLQRDTKRFPFLTLSVPIDMESLSSGSEGYYKAEKGETVVGFEIKLPSQLPSTLNSDLVKRPVAVKYLVMGYCEIKTGNYKLASVSHVIPTTLHENLPILLNSLINDQSLEVEKLYTLPTLESTIKLKLSISDKISTAGSPLTIKFGLEKAFYKMVSKIKLELIETVRYARGMPETTTKAQHDSNSFLPSKLNRHLGNTTTSRYVLFKRTLKNPIPTKILYEQEERLWNLQLPLPITCQTVKLAKYSSVTYSIRVSTSFFLSRSYSIEIPVLIYPLASLLVDKDILSLTNPTTKLSSEDPSAYKVTTTSFTERLAIKNGLMKSDGKYPAPHYAFDLDSRRSFTISNPTRKSTTDPNAPSNCSSSVDPIQEKEEKSIYEDLPKLFITWEWPGNLNSIDKLNGDSAFNSNTMVKESVLETDRNTTTELIDSVPVDSLPIEAKGCHSPTQSDLNSLLGLINPEQVQEYHDFPPLSTNILSVSPQFQEEPSSPNITHNFNGTPNITVVALKSASSFPKQSAEDSRGTNMRHFGQLECNTSEKPEEFSIPLLLPLSPIPSETLIDSELPSLVLPPILDNVLRRDAKTKAVSEYEYIKTGDDIATFLDDSKLLTQSPLLSPQINCEQSPQISLHHSVSSNSITATHTISRSCSIDSAYASSIIDEVIEQSISNSDSFDYLWDPYLDFDTTKKTNHRYSIITDPFLPIDTTPSLSPLLKTNETLTSTSFSSPPSDPRPFFLRTKNHSIYNSHFQLDSANSSTTSLTRRHQPSSPSLSDQHYFRFKHE